MKSHILLLIAVFTILSSAVCGQQKTPKKIKDLPNGISLAYQEIGRSDGTPVILLHGFTDTGRSFQRVAEELLKKDSCYRIIVPDLRGHGMSSLPDGKECRKQPGKCFTIDLFMEDVVLLMDALQIGNAYIAGHSLGSVVAQRIALRRPERVRGVVLIAPIVSGIGNPVIHEFVNGEMIGTVFRKATAVRGERWPHQVYDLRPSDLGKPVVKFLEENWVVEPATPDSFLQAVAEETVVTRLGTWIGTADNLKLFDHRNALTRLAVPALVLYATADPLTREDTEWADMLRCLRIAAVNGNMKLSYKAYGRIKGHSDAPDLNHNFHWTVPESVAADIATFIERQLPDLMHTFLDENGCVVTVMSRDHILILSQELTRHIHK